MRLCLEPVHERVSIHSLSKIISHAVSSELGPLFGLKFAENIHATTYHCYGLMLISSPTLRQFCLRLSRYYAWVTTNKSVSFEVQGDIARLVYNWQGDTEDSPKARLARISGWAATWVRMLRMVSSPGFAPKAVTFSCPAPLGFVEDYQQYFRCPLQFGKDIGVEFLGRIQERMQERRLALEIKIDGTFGQARLGGNQVYCGVFITSGDKQP